MKVLLAGVKGDTAHATDKDSVARAGCSLCVVPGSSEHLPQRVSRVDTQAMTERRPEVALLSLQTLTPQVGPQFHILHGQLGDWGPQSGRTLLSD